MAVKRTIVETCPNAAELVAFANGCLQDPVTLDSISQHLEQCESCIEIVGKSQSSDAFVDSLKRAVTRASKSGSTEIIDSGYQQALDRVMQIGATPANLPVSQSGNSTHNDAGPTTPDSTLEDVDDSSVGEADSIGPYQLIEKIGEGGMGVVYRAFHVRMNRPVAIKLLPKSRLGDERARKRFLREMQAVGQINHPNMVIGHDAGEIDGHYYLAMELLEGFDLSTLASIEGEPLRWPDACELIRVTAIALKYAHKNGIVHRDVKPSNIMLCVNKLEESGEHDTRSNGTIVKLLDLGLARVEQPDPSSLTRTGHDQIMGTVDFMSPEQCVDSSEVDSRSDIYSLGATLFYLLVGTAPLKAAGYKTQGQKLRGLLSEPIPSLSEFRDDLPNELVELVDRCLKRDPYDRYQDIRELIKALEPLAADHHLSALLKRTRNNPDHVRTSDDMSFEVGVVEGSRSAEDKDEEPTRTEIDVVKQLVPGAKGRKRSVALWSLLVAVPLLLIAASIIWLKTDGGYLRIESEPGVHVSVELLKDGKKVDTIAIGSDQKEHWYRSGNYEIRLPAKLRDQLAIDSGEFKLARGGGAVVTITKVTDEQYNDAIKAGAVAKDTDGAGDVEILEPIDPREVARWVIKNRGAITTEVGVAHKLSELPKEEFEIHKIGLLYADDEKVRTLVGLMERLEKCHSLYLNGGRNRMVTDGCMADISRLKNLKWLSFESAKITDAGIAKLKPMPNLTSLGLLDLYITEKCLARVSVKFPNLYRLELNSRSLAGSDLLPLTTMKHLRNLDLITPRITHELVEPLQSTQIDQLIVRGAQSIDAGAMECVARMPNLQMFEMQNINIGDDHLLTLTACASLKFLRFGGTLVSVDGLRSFIDQRPEIVIYLTHPESPLMELKNLPQVKDVSLPGPYPPFRGIEPGNGVENSGGGESKKENSDEKNQANGG